MTRDDIIRMAREAGWSGLYMQWAEPTGNPDWSPVKESLTVPVTIEQIERFAALVSSAALEACEKACEEIASDNNPYVDNECDGAMACLSAIRALK